MSSSESPLSLFFGTSNGLNHRVRETEGELVENFSSIPVGHPSSNRDSSANDPVQRTEAHDNSSLLPRLTDINTRKALTIAICVVLYFLFLSSLSFRKDYQIVQTLSPSDQHLKDFENDPSLVNALSKERKEIDVYHDEKDKANFTELFRSITSIPWENLQPPSSDIKYIKNVSYSIILSSVVKFLRDKKNHTNDNEHNTTFPPDLSPSAITDVLSSRSQNQLYSLVSNIIQHHNDVPYHSVHHIFHVLISSNKMLHMILQQDQNEASDLAKSVQKNSFLHFVFIFSAFIHDLDHLGVSNKQLIDEDHPLAKKYSKDTSSIAEFHSISLAFEILVKEEYSHLVKEVFGENENSILGKFHESVKKFVLNTDITNEKRQESLKDSYMRLVNRDTSQDDEEKVFSPALELCLLVCDTASATQLNEIHLDWGGRLFEELKQANPDFESQMRMSWPELQISFYEKHVFNLLRDLEKLEVISSEDMNHLFFLAQESLDYWREKIKNNEK
eukprot:CAMPEP_0178941660 /NCGR_PEP_ID=MMETSP0789-20121207/1533_1 /TAXON_ID=3005 /ORGANISM="Rhizosolenia setigera, Strain CCMP 1694" /LENGTH=502 /DNA_ID=CAMNT_0020620925 /DNA_START=2072 /DNA_END=3580 /DNA_ORIENTATION=-